MTETAPAPERVKQPRGLKRPVIPAVGGEGVHPDLLRGRDPACRS